MNKLEEKRMLRKNTILTEAKKLILKRGISDGLMSEIAKASGISRQRLYDYYNNIDDILYDIMDLVYNNSYVTKVAVAENLDPITVIKYSIMHFPNLSDSSHDDLLFLSLYGVYNAVNKTDSSRKVFTKRIGLYENQIAEGQQSGIFRTDYSTKELSTITTHMVAAFTYHSATLDPHTRGTMLSTAVLKHLCDMVLNFLQDKE